jgi:transglutaminase-like putative cysteine protease
VLIILAAALFATPSVIEQLTVSSYRSYMTNINKPAMLAAIRTNITAFLGYSNQTYSLQDLFKWEGTYMKFVNGALNNRPTDPTAILASGKGKCQEFSILFAAACLSMKCITPTVLGFRSIQAGLRQQD